MNIYQKIAINISKFIDELNNDEIFKKENPDISAKEYVSIHTGIKIKRLNNIIKGIAKTRIYEVYRIAVVLGIEITDIITDEVINKKYENKKKNLTDLLDKQVYKKDIIYLLKILSEEDLFIPFNNNHLIELYTSDNKIYIPLFTSIKQTSGLIYTRLDKVKLEIVIKDIFSLGKYYAISINPFTNDFILNKKLIYIIDNLIINKR